LLPAAGDFVVAAVLGGGFGFGVETGLFLILVFTAFELGFLVVAGLRVVVNGFLVVAAGFLVVLTVIETWLADVVDRFVVVAGRLVVGLTDVAGRLVVARDVVGGLLVVGRTVDAVASKLGGRVVGAGFFVVGFGLGFGLGLVVGVGVVVVVVVVVVVGVVVRVVVGVAFVVVAALCLLIEFCSAGRLLAPGLLLLT